MTALETLVNDANTLATDTEAQRDTAGSEKIRGCNGSESYTNFC